MKFQSILIFICFIIGIKNSVAQEIQTSSFDKSLQQLTDILISKLQSKSQLKMAVWDLSTLNGDISPIGKYIAEDISINLSDKFHIANRNQLSTLLKENKLKSEGFINQVTMQQIKKLSDIEIIITGTVSILADHIKITLQSLDADANIVAATKGEVPMNDDVKELMGIRGPSRTLSGSTSNLGFNHPLSSNEQINNPETVNKDCIKKNTGDYCFMNNGNKKVCVVLDPPEDFMITLEIGQTQCFYNLEARSWTYQIWSEKDQEQRAQNSIYELTKMPFCRGNCPPPDQKGQISVEKCQSKTFNIK